MTAPRALAAAKNLLPDDLIVRLASLGEKAKKKADEVLQTHKDDKVFTPLFERISKTLQQGSEPEAVTLIARAERLLNRPVADALAVEDMARKMNPSRRGKTGFWDPEVARATKADQGGRVKQTPEEKAKSAEKRKSDRAARRESNQTRTRQLQAEMRGKSAEEKKALKEAYDAETTRLWGGSGISVAKHMNVEGGAMTDLLAARRKAMQEVNKRHQAGEITGEQAQVEYGQIREGHKQGRKRIIEKNKEGDGLGMNARVDDVADAQDGAYYDVNNPQARDREEWVRGTGGQKLRTVKGGLDQNVVTATAVTRRHIERMIAQGEIPGAPPDAAMPGIIRTAMQELKIPDQGIDDHALMRAYRQQGRRGSAFPTRRRPGDSGPEEGAVGDIDMAGELSLANMTSKLRDRSETGMGRQEIEEGFVDDIARGLDADEGAAVPIPGRELAQRVRQTADATVDNPENTGNMSFRELESARRARKRAMRLNNQVNAMEEGSTEYAEKSNKNRMLRNAASPERRGGPRQALIAGDLGSRTFTSRGRRIPEQRDEMGNVTRPEDFRQSLALARDDSGISRRPGEPGDFGVNPDQRFGPQVPDGPLGRERMEERPPFQGPRQSLGEVRPFRSPHGGVEETPQALREENIRLGYSNAQPGQAMQPREDGSIYAVMEDAQLLLDEIEGGVVDPAQAVPALRDLMMRIVRTTEAGVQKQRGQVPTMSPTRSDVSWMYRTSPEAGSEGPTYGARGGYDGPSAAEGQIRGQADEDIDRLVRVLMERVGRMGQGQQDEYFAGSPLDRQMMLNRDRSRSFREVQDQASRDTPDKEWGGDAIPFPSQMGRQYPREENRSNIIRMILEAMSGGQ